MNRAYEGVNRPAAFKRGRQIKTVKQWEELEHCRGANVSVTWFDWKAAVVDC